MKQIIVEITEAAEVKIEVVNYKGGSCEQATHALEAGLGLVTGRRKKPEYYQSQRQPGQQKVGT